MTELVGGKGLTVGDRVIVGASVAITGDGSTTDRLGPLMGLVGMTAT